MSIEYWKRRIGKLGDAMTLRRCNCPPEPEPGREPSDENIVAVIELPPIRDLPCPKCRGLRDIVYVQRIIRTTDRVRE